jgi:hypothetical protein
MTSPPRPWFWRDEDGVILSGMVKLILGLAIAGFILIEAGQIVFARISVQDLADRAAAAAADAYDDTGSIDAARDAAEEVVATDESAKIREKKGSFVVNPVDRSVRIVLRKRASTLIVDKIGFLEGFTIAEGRATAHPPPV